MKSCPFCVGQIPDSASKCQHCGEWIDGKTNPNSNTELGRVANRFVTVWIFLSVGGFVIGVAFFFLFWLPNWNKMQRDFDNFPKTQVPFQK